jgi:hypothetical protein
MALTNRDQKLEKLTEKAKYNAKYFEDVQKFKLLRARSIWGRQV